MASELNAAGSTPERTLSPRGAWVPLALFVLLTLIVATDLLRPLDTWTELAVRGLWSPALAWSWAGLYVAGSVLISTVVLLVAAVALGRHGNRRLAAGIIVAFVVANAVEIILKRSLPQLSPPPVQGMIPIHLPEDALQQFVLARLGMLGPRGDAVNSYPSGHMLRSLLILFAIAAAWPGRAVRWAAGLAGAAAAFILIAARVHWLSDVAGGALLAWSLAAATVAWAARPITTSASTTKLREANQGFPSPSGRGRG